jgi:hypothetical protein
MGMRAAMLVLLLAGAARADSSLPPAETRRAPWHVACAERLERRRRQLEKVDPAWASARVEVETRPGWTLSVRLVWWGEFWAGVSLAEHDSPESQIKGTDGWYRSGAHGAWMRHLHPRSAGIYGRDSMSAEDWQALVDTWRPLLDACLRDRA